MKKVFTIPNLVYFLFSALYISWVLVTYRNIIHMDMIDIVSTKVKHLMEHNLQPADFVYEALFPASTSITFTLINAYFFHLNTVIEIAAGAFFLAAAGYVYLRKMSVHLANNRQKFFFALLTGFLVFGLHKWEASFTSFFSFAVSLNLMISFLNYFFVFRYIDEDQSGFNRFCIPLVIFSNLLLIFEAEAYYYGYALVILLFLVSIRWYGLMAFNRKRWNTIFVVNVCLVVFAGALMAYLKSIPSIKPDQQHPTIGGFVHLFLEEPLWVIKFYLIAQSGPFLGEAYNHAGLRAMAGLLILIAYGTSIVYVIRRKEKRLYVMVAMIFYNIVTCGFVTLGRYGKHVLEAGASSRYSLFNLSGVLGLITIIFFYIFESGSKIYKAMAWIFLGAAIAGYLFVDVRQLEIAPYRTENFKVMKEALLTRENLDILQAKPAISMKAIDVLEQYHLNVYYAQEGANRYYGQKGTAGAGGGVLNLDDVKDFTLVSGTPAFAALNKSGFYGDEKGISWTNGKASIVLDEVIEVKDSLVLQLNTYMPPSCKNVNPKLSWFDVQGLEHLPSHFERKGDMFYFFFFADKTSGLQRISILSENIDAGADTRVLSFPFISLEIKK